MSRRKREILIVDGYNIINAWDSLKEAQAASLDEAREMLIDILAELKSLTGDHTIVVFDSYLQKNVKRQIEIRKGVEIVFTKEYETADNYIESVVANAKRNEYYKVASSDAIVQSMIFGKGARRISANELLFYYQDAKNNVISTVSKKIKLNKNMVSLDPKSLEVIELLEQKLKD